ncbi:MAG: O-antigen ligase domain-containing protein, partial [Actinomycetota bacterium]|nr:O-antigen ligase domain-containing protein [Actinomycetota bacterium]
IKVKDQLTSKNQFNSAHQRLAWYHDSLSVFHVSPWLGVGLRWWYTNRFPFQFQPPNAELEMLTSGGIVGLVAMFVLYGGGLERLRRLDWEFGTLAFAALLMRVTQAQFDIFWVTGQSSLPFMIVGVALGARMLARQRATACALPGDGPARRKEAAGPRVPARALAARTGGPGVARRTT